MAASPAHLVPPEPPSPPARASAKEIQVERVKFLRYGEARSDYDQVVAAVDNTE